MVVASCEFSSLMKMSYRCAIFVNQAVKVHLLMNRAATCLKPRAAIGAAMPVVELQTKHSRASRPQSDPKGDPKGNRKRKHRPMAWLNC